jgi:predicted site-specific integrase-resolvase
VSNLYRVNEFAKRVGKSASTLRRWDVEGRLPAKRSAGGQRYYNDEDVRKALLIDVPVAEKKVVVYCRVSSKGQADDLKSQVDAMRSFCLGAGIAVDDWILRRQSWLQNRCGQPGTTITTAGDDRRPDGHRPYIQWPIVWIAEL